jgi:hypothetical protein
MGRAQRPDRWTTSAESTSDQRRRRDHQCCVNSPCEAPSATNQRADNVAVSKHHLRQPGLSRNHRTRQRTDRIDRFDSALTDTFSSVHGRPPRAGARQIVPCVRALTRLTKRPRALRRSDRLRACLDPNDPVSRSAVSGGQPRGVAQPCAHTLATPANPCRDMQSGGPNRSATVRSTPISSRPRLLPQRLSMHRDTPSERTAAR